MAANDLSHTNHDSTTLDLNDGTIYRLSEIRGIRGSPGQIVTSEVAFVTPVARYEGFNPDRRIIEMDIVVRGILGTNLDTRIGALYAHFWPDQRDDELGVLTYTNMEGTQRALEVAPPAGESAPDAEWFVPGLVGTSTVVVTIALEGMEPSLYSPSWVSDTGNFNGTNDVNISMANAGDVDGYLHIAIGGPVTADWSITDAYSNALTFADDVDGGETLTMYLHKQEKLFFITHSVDGDWRGQRSSASVMPVAKYGTNNITFKGGDAGDNGAITCKHYPRYSTFR